MEVSLEAPVDQPLPEDTFLSLRIGDGQKQARFTASRTYRFPTKGAPRTYKFPDAADYKDAFGRVEVYKRIGVATVVFDKQVGKLKEVLLPCSEPGFPRLQMGMSVTSEVTPTRHEEKAQRLNERLDLAQAYLDKHHIPELIAEAMRKVMHEKPDDPHTVLSSFITSQGPEPGPPPPPTAQKPERPPGEVEERERESYGKNASSGPPPLPSAQKPDPPPGEVEERDRESYGKDGPPPLPPSGPKPRRPGEVDEAEQEAWCKLQAAQKAEEEREEQELAEQLARVPFRIRPSVGSWLARPRSRLTGQLGVTPFRHLPSVGTWAAAPPPEEPAAPPAHRFKHLPSVGTWLPAPVEVDMHEVRQQRFVLERSKSSLYRAHGHALQHLEKERNEVLSEMARAQESGDRAKAEELQMKASILMISLQAVRNEHEAHQFS